MKWRLLKLQEPFQSSDLLPTLWSRGLSSSGCTCCPESYAWLGAGCRPATMQAALQYMAGELKVERGDVLPLLATHNTVRMRFDMEEAEYLHLAKTDAAFPLQHFSMLADTARNEVRVGHSCRAVQCKAYPPFMHPSAGMPIA